MDVAGKDVASGDVVGGDVGTVEQLWVYPVKSLAGQRVAEVSVAGTGLAGDRAWAVVADADGARVTARTAPGLRAASAQLAAGEAGVLVRVADAPATGGDADAALSAIVGRRVHLAAAGAGESHVDVAPVHLVSREAMVHAAGVEHAEHEGACPCSSEDPRANVVLRLDLPGGRDETALVGSRLALGQAVLRVIARPKHCLGVYAEVVSPGRVREGDPLRLLGPADRPGETA